MISSVLLSHLSRLTSGAFCHNISVTARRVDFRFAGQLRDLWSDLVIASSSFVKITPVRHPLRSCSKTCTGRHIVDMVLNVTRDVVFLCRDVFGARQVFPNEKVSKKQVFCLFSSGVKLDPL